MGSVTNLAEKRKIRSCEAATQNIPLMPIVSQDDTDDTYIFSKKIDKSIDGCIPYVLFFAMVYFAAQGARYLLSWGR